MSRWEAGSETLITQISLYFIEFSLDFCAERMYDEGVLRKLVEAVEEVQIPVCGDDIAEVISLIDRLSAKVTEAVGAFDKAGIWDIEGATSMTAWLRHRARMSGGAASTMSRTARRLGELPVTAAAWLDGSLSSGQVQAVVANVSDATIEMFAGHEPAVVPPLCELSVADFADLVRGLPGEFVEGGSVDPATIASLLCDSDLRRLITKGRSVILDFGVATRVVSDNLFSALVLRDRHCRHPGCDRQAKWCEAHHVIPVSEGGPTHLANLVLKCSRHHHLGHKPGWSEKVEPDGTFHITNPSGRTFITYPPGVGRMMFGDAA